MNWKHILRLWSLTNKNRKFSLYLLVAIVLCSSIAEVFTIGAIIPFISVLANPEGLFIHDKIQNLFQFFGVNSIESIKKSVTVIFILGIVISGTTRLLLVYLTNRIGYLIGADLTQLIYSTSISQSYEFHLNSNSSKMINILVSKINSSIQSTIIPFIQFIASIILTCFIIMMIVFVDPVSSIYILSALTLTYLLISVITNKILINNGRIISKNHEIVIRLLRNSTNGIREVILNRLQHSFIKLYSKSDFILRKSQAINSFIAASPRFLVEMFAIVILAMAAYFSNNLSKSELDTLPYIAMIVFAAQRLLPIMQQLYLSWASIQGAKANVEDMLDFFDGLKKNNNTYDKMQINFKKYIEFKNVYFKFANRKEIIRLINFKINKGEKIGIIGETGSGKSTILNLLLGLIDPSSGDILIDGVKLSKNRISDWQSQISSVSQNMFFLDDSIKNNIIFNVEEKRISKKKFNDSLDISQIKTFVDSLDKGMDTVIGEDGSRLSGGQKQRIAIARALYKPHEILILDEATSALDQNTEEKIMNSIYGLKNKTIIIISHKINSLKGCDKIIKIKDGMIVEIGTYEEVILKG